MDCTVGGVAELDTTERLSLSLFYPAHFLSLISSTLLPQVPLLQGSFFKILTFSRNRCPFICSLYCAYVLSCFSHVQLFGTLWTVAGHMDCSPPGSSVHGILQARTLQWVVISSSRGFSQPRDQMRVSCIAGADSACKRGVEKCWIRSVKSTDSNCYT